MQVVHTPVDSPRGKLLSQYTLARINSMKGIDLTLFDFDRHNAIYYFALNTQEDIYFRYGGRDSESASSYLNLESLELALTQGLKIHQAPKRKTLPKPTKPKAKFPRQIPGLNENVVQQNRCVECHHIAHFETQFAEKNNTLNKLSAMFRNPNIKTLGIYLDIPKGLRVEKSNGPAKIASLAEGDLITRINNHDVTTFADLQYYLDKVDRSATSLQLTVVRNTIEKNLTIALPPLWWKTDIAYRNWTINPLTFFSSRRLTNAEKVALNLPNNGIASLVTDVPIDAMFEAAHTLKEGDIITAVDGKEVNSLHTGVELHIQLYHKSGSKVTLDVIREGEKITLPLQTKRKFFRRVEE